jgi:hypothetical protein
MTLPENHPQKQRSLPEIGPNGRTARFTRRTEEPEVTTRTDSEAMTDFWISGYSLGSSNDIFSDGRKATQPEPRITRTRRWSETAKATARFLALGLAAILLTGIVAVAVWYVRSTL